MSLEANNKDVISNGNTIDKIKDRLQVLQSSFVEQMDEKLGEVVAEILREVESSDLLISHTQIVEDEESQKYSNRKKSDKQGALPDKQFLARNSLLTDLFRINHIRTIYHIFIAILIILFLNTVIFDLVDTGRLNFAGFRLILWSFGELPTAMMVWLCMFCSTLGLYLCFYLFATHRTRLHPSIVCIWDVAWLCFFTAYQSAFVYAPLYILLHYDLPPASSLIVLMEQVRLIMKNHAFVRSNSSQARDYKAESEADANILSPCPGFSKFLYFLFVPTLVYRDKYPRTKQVRWREVAWRLLEVIGVIFYTSFIFERLLIPEFRRFGQRPLAAKNLVLLVFGSMMPGTLAMLGGFFCLLHSLLNAVAEMTCFADRMFYKDWWNSSSFNDFFRTWNVIVHDWLYTYVYKDFYEHVLSNTIVSKLMTFAVSAVIHEFVLTFAFRYFYPVILVMFGGLGVALSFIRRKGNAGNVFMWLSLCMGIGLFLSFFSMEWYARINCPSSHDDSTLLNYVIPRSWTCLTLEANTGGTSQDPAFIP